jgi:eukaryotic-like serine/threonine-protein kinase
MVRDLGDDGALVIGNTDGATCPFWSPDGRWIGFSAHGRLMRVASDGGSPVVIDGAVGAWGGAWSASRIVVFQPAVRNAGLLQVPESGGRPAPASILDDSAGDIVHRDPVVLPDGGSLLYCLDSTNTARRGLYLARLDAAGAAQRIGACPATYVPVAGNGGLLLSAAASHIEVRAFDTSHATAEVLAYALSAHSGEAPRHIGIVIGWRRLMRQPPSGSQSD